MYPGVATTKKINHRRAQVLPFNNKSSDIYKVVAPCMLAPAVNLCENESEYRLLLAAPGLQREDFCIEINDQLIVISAKREPKSKECSNDRCEFDYSDWTRAFALPQDSDSILAHAKYKNGELLIRIPRGNTKESSGSTNVYVY